MFSNEKLIDSLIDEIEMPYEEFAARLDSIHLPSNATTDTDSYSWNEEYIKKHILELKRKLDYSHKADLLSSRFMPKVTGSESILDSRIANMFCKEKTIIRSNGHT